jgi:hypothetical protein
MMFFMIVEFDAPKVQNVDNTTDHEVADGANVPASLLGRLGLAADTPWAGVIQHLGIASPPELRYEFLDGLASQAPAILVDDARALAEQTATDLGTAGLYSTEPALRVLSTLAVLGEF